MRSVSRLFLAELTKIWRTKFPYFGLVASALVAVIAKQIVDRNEVADEATMSGYLSVALNLCSTLVAPIFVVIFAAMLVASETSRGTYRMVLPRPITRSSFLTAKLLAGLMYMVLIFAANLAVAVPIAMRYPLHSASDANAQIPGALEQTGIYATAVLLTLLPHVATVCFGFLISVLSTNVGTAIGVAVGVLLSLLPISVFVQIGDFRLKDWLFSEHYDTAIGIATERAQLISGATWDQAKVYSLLATSLLSIAVFLALSYTYFTRRDLNL